MKPTSFPRARQVVTILTGALFLAALAGCNSHWAVAWDSGCGHYEGSSVHGNGAGALVLLGIVAVAEGIRIIASGCR